MHETPLSTPCPFCAESIKVDAKLCRFCGNSTLKSLTILFCPALRHEDFQALFDSYGKKFYSSYGLFRKQFSEKSAPIFTGLTQKDVLILEPLLEKNHIKYEWVLAQPPSQKSPLFFSYTTMFFSMLGIAGMIWIFQQSFFSPRKDLTLDAPPIAETHSQLMIGSDPAAAKTQTKKNIQTMIQATATLETASSTGSAFFIHPQGFLITNAHVVGKEETVTVVTQNKQKHQGFVLKKDPMLDLALIEIRGSVSSFPTLPLGDATQLDQGDTVFTVGAPKGLDFSVAKGIVSFAGRPMNGKAYIQSDVAINPGNSGGPMINEAGQIVGINTFVISEAEGLNFSLPINYIYTGENPIAQGILPTKPYSTLFAKWQKESQTSSAFAVFAPKTQNSRSSALISELGKLNAHHKTEQDAFQKSIERLKNEVEILKSHFEKNPSKLAADDVNQKIFLLLKEQEKLSDLNLQYCSRARDIMLDIKSQDVSMTANIESELQKLESSEKMLLTSKALLQTQLQQFVPGDS